MTQQTRNRIAFVIVFVIFGLLPFFALQQAWDYRRLVTDEATAPGMVTKVDRRWHRQKWFSEQYDYDADYSFIDSAGRPQNGRQGITHEQYLAWRAKGANHDVEVHYARSDPTLSAISLDRMRRDTRWLVILALLGAGALAGGYWIETRRQRPSVSRRLGERIDAYYARQRGPAGPLRRDGDGTA